MGNENSSIVYFTVDTTPPTITIYSPKNITYASSNIDLNVSANEAINTWWYSLDGGANTTFVPNITLTGLAEGQHQVIVYANDSVGNVGTSSVYFTVDTTPPLVTIITPTPSYYNANFIVNASVYDTGAGATGVSTVYRWENVTANGTWILMTIRAAPSTTQPST